MLKKFFTILLFLTIAHNSFSQKWKLTRYEVMAGVSFVNYFGDIGGATTPNNWFGLKDISLLGTRPSTILGIRYKLKQDMALKLNFNLGWMSGSDRNSLNEMREGSFNTFFLEHTLQYEYSVIAEDKKSFSFALFNKRGMMNNFSKINLYGYFGLGGLAFTPNYSTTNPVKDSLELIQNKFSYTFIIPAGIGVKYILSSHTAINFEFGARYAFSDYLDGYSNVRSSFNDVYYLMSGTLVYRIKTSRKGYPILFRSY